MTENDSPITSSNWCERRNQLNVYSVQEFLVTRKSESSDIEKCATFEVIPTDKSI